MDNRIPFVVVVAILFVGCQQDPVKTPAPPDKVVRKYQEFIDKNNFNGARALSTIEGRQLIDDIEASIDDELLEETVLNTYFHNITCRVEGRDALCWCDLEDQYERYEALFQLVQVKGRWFIDVPSEDAPIDYEKIEEMVEELLDSSS